jgi:hypothetical protein
VTNLTAGEGTPEDITRPGASVGQDGRGREGLRKRDQKVVEKKEKTEKPAKETSKAQDSHQGSARKE